MLKFSLARSALLGVVSKAVPRCTAHASSTCAASFQPAPRLPRSPDLQAAPASFHDPKARKPKAQYLSPCKFQKLRFRQIRMCFDLDHRRLDSCRFVGQNSSKGCLTAQWPGICRGPQDSPSPSRCRAKSCRGRKGHRRFDPADPAPPPVEMQMECE